MLKQQKMLLSNYLSQVLVVERMRIFYGSGRHYSDLLIWLEGHLDQPLSLDNVARKQVIPSGTYRECLKMSLASYWRVYSCSSFVEIGGRTTPTARPILDIALQYRFDSQQTLPAHSRSSLPRLLHFTAVLLMERLWYSPAATSG